MKRHTLPPTDIVLGALFAFWQRGFENTDMPQLLESMGVDDESFYGAFSSKRDIFLKSLDLYLANVDSDLSALISRSADAESAVAALIDGVLAAAKTPAFTTTEWRGCLMGNTALEFGARDLEIVSRLKSGIEIVRAQFRNALSLPTVSGAKPSKDRIERSALYLMAGIQGLLVLAKSGLSETDIETVRSAILASAVRPANAASSLPAGTRERK